VGKQVLFVCVGGGEQNCLTAGVQRVCGKIGRPFCDCTSMENTTGLVTLQSSSSSSSSLSKPVVA
jgi:hypothetical protein